MGESLETRFRNSVLFRSDTHSDSLTDTQRYVKRLMEQVNKQHLSLCAYLKLTTWTNWPEIQTCTLQAPDNKLQISFILFLIIPFYEYWSWWIKYNTSRWITSFLKNRTVLCFTLNARTWAQNIVKNAATLHLYTLKWYESCVLQHISHCRCSLDFVSTSTKLVRQTSTSWGRLLRGGAKCLSPLQI